jgi:hypothetical protein
MANDGPQPVNIDTGYLYRQMLQGGGGTSLFGVFQDVNFANALKMPGLKSDATLACRAPKKPGLFAKLLQDAGLTGAGLSESLQKIAQAGPVQQASQADLFGSGGPVGGFVSAASSGGRGGDDFGLSA